MYGISQDQRDYIDEKIERNKSYLKNFSFDIDGQSFNLLDGDMNANISPQRYFSEVNNRVNTLFNYAKEKGLKPIFGTITAPPELHPTSKTDKSPYSILTRQRQFKYDGLKYTDINPHDTSLYLSDLWAKFLRLSIFKKLKKQLGSNMIYLRVYEPMKSGVPHIHFMIFIPVNFVQPVKQKFYEYFGKYGIKQLDFRYTWHNQAGGAVAYILKYINKTFKNAKLDTMTDEAYYFALHRIRRFITSQTLIPLKYYRKIKHKEDLQNMRYSTQLYNDGVIASYFNDTCIIQIILNEDFELYDHVIYSKDYNIAMQFHSKLVDYETKRFRTFKKYCDFAGPFSVTHQDEICDLAAQQNVTDPGQIFCDLPAIKNNVTYPQEICDFAAQQNVTDHFHKFLKLNSYVYKPKDDYPTIPTKWTKINSSQPLKVVLEGKEYLYINKKLSRPTISYEKMSHYDLLHYYNTLDITTCDLNHYGHINNLLFDRGLVTSKYIFSDQRNLQHSKRLSTLEHYRRTQDYFYKHYGIKLHN